MSTRPSDHGSKNSSASSRRSLRREPYGHPTPVRGRSLGATGGGRPVRSTSRSINGNRITGRLLRFSVSCATRPRCGSRDDGQAVRLARQVAGGDEPQPLASAPTPTPHSAPREIVVHRLLRTRKDVPQQGEYRPLDSLTPGSTRRARNLEETAQIAFQALGSFGSIVTASPVERQSSPVTAGTVSRATSTGTIGCHHSEAPGARDVPSRPVWRAGRGSPGCPTRLRSCENDPAVPDRLEESSARTTHVGAGRGCRGRLRARRQRPRESTRSSRAANGSSARR